MTLITASGRPRSSGGHGRAGARPRGPRRSRGSRRRRPAAAAGRAARARGRRASSASSAASMPRSRGTPSGTDAVDLDPAVAQHERGRRATRPTKENRLQRSPCSTDSSRKPGPVADQLGVGGHRRLEVGQQLRPDRHDRVLGGQAGELLASSGRIAQRRPSARRQAPKRRKKHECAPVWQAPPPSWSTTNSSTSPSQS